MIDGNRIHSTSVDSRTHLVEQNNCTNYRKIAALALGALGILTLAYISFRNFGNSGNVPMPHYCSSDIVPSVCRPIKTGEVYIVGWGTCECPPGMIRKFSAFVGS